MEIYRIRSQDLSPDELAIEVCGFLENEIFLMFGVPEVILTDNGRQFESLLVQNLCQKYGVRHVFTAKYAPQANASERVNRTLLASLRAYIKSDQTVWDSNLSAVTHALRNSVHDSSKYSPHFLVFGQHAVLHGSLYEILRQASQFGGNHLHSEEKPEYLYKVYDNVQNNLIKAADKYKTRYDLRSRYPNIKVGQFVFIKNFKQSKAIDKYAAKLAPKFIKCVVTQLVGNVACEVANEDGNILGVYHFKDVKT